MAYVFPGYITKYNFNQEKLDEIFKSRAIENEIDQFNNLILSTEFSDTETIDDPEKFLILVETKRMNYDLAAVENFTDTEFTEFESDTATFTDSISTPSYDEIDSDMANQLAQENILQAQIDELSNMVELEANKTVKFQEDAEMNFRAAKGVIVKQRIAAGEGKEEIDFSDAFPFLPLTEEQKLAGETGVENSSVMRTPRGIEYQ